jgi:excisionase family DNA binding protein
LFWPEGSVDNVSEQGKQYFTVAQVAARLRVTEKTVRNLIGKKRLKAVRVGRAVRISEAAIKLYLGD